MIESISLRDYQIEAVKRLKNGNILCGGVGSGKSRTALAYYHKTQGGYLDPFVPMQQTSVLEPGLLTDANYAAPCDLYIITTARKRDTGEWEDELRTFYLSTDPTQNYYTNTVVIDSWNNIEKYAKVKSAFFIFDEQRVPGYGVWAKAFLKIAKSNKWILLSATPGDKWEDYMAVFIANGFYKNKTEFVNRHIVYDCRTKFPKVVRYEQKGILLRHRRDILVDMDFERETVRECKTVLVDYDTALYKSVYKQSRDEAGNPIRINPFTNEPVKNASELCQCLRRIINEDPRRIEEVRKIVFEKHRCIIFYNFNYELELLRNADWTDADGNVYDIAEWNGQRHQEIPTSEHWIYLVQYSAGSEGWNCLLTDTIIFYSLNYSYRIMEQAAGRIDRMNTPFHRLWYYYIRSAAPIDICINRAIKQKRKFNESAFASKTE